jgi:hypothetical protein
MRGRFRHFLVVLGLVVTLVVAWFPWPGSLWVMPVVTVAIAIAFYRSQVTAFAKASLAVLDRLTPLFMLISAVASTIAATILLRTPVARIGLQMEDPIIFDADNGALFNSWSDQRLKRGPVSVWGEQPDKMSWIIDQNRDARFHYQTDLSISTSDSEDSSGGYFTFYSLPRNRSDYSEFSFECLATTSSGEPAGQFNIGVRLTVDEPPVKNLKAIERVIYEIPNLNAYSLKKQNADRACGPKWQTFKLELDDFRVVREDRPLPPNLSKDAVNKVVFFINDKIVLKPSEAATRPETGLLWFRSAEFRRR